MTTRCSALAGVLGLFVATSGFAQDSRIKWEPLDSPKLRLKIHFPGKPEYKERTDDGVDGKPMTTHSYTVEVGPNIFSVAMTELPFDLRSEGVPSKVFFDGEQRGEVEAAHGQLVSSRAIVLGEQEGREFIYRFAAVDGRSDRVTKVQSFVVGRRHYSVRLNAGTVDIIDQDDLGKAFFKSFELSTESAADKPAASVFEAVANSTWIRARSAALSIEAQFPKRPDISEQLPQFKYHDPADEATFEVVCMQLGAMVKEREGSKAKLGELYSTIFKSMLDHGNGKLIDSRDVIHEGRMARRVEWAYSPQGGTWRGSALLIAAGDTLFVASISRPTATTVPMKTLEQFFTSVRPLATVPKEGAVVQKLKIETVAKPNLKELKKKLIGKWGGEVLLIAGGGRITDRVGEETWIIREDGTYEMTRFIVTLRTTVEGKWKIGDSGMLELSQRGPDGKWSSSVRGLSFTDDGVTIKSYGMSEESRLARLTLKGVPARPTPAKDLGDRNDIHPLKNAKVGDWAKYKQIDKLGRIETTWQLTKTVIARDANKLTIKAVMKFADGKTEEFDESFDLSMPIPIAKRMGYSDSQKVEIAKAAATSETVFVCDREFKATRTEYSVKAPGAPGSAKFTLWTADDAPLTQLLRDEIVSEYSQSVLTTILVAFGSKEASSAPAAPMMIKNTLGMTLARIPAGTFDMGVLPVEEFATRYRAAAGEEAQLELLAISPPRRSKTIGKDYFMGIHEITIGQFRQFVVATKYKTDAEKDGKGGTGRTDEGSFEDQPKFNWQNYGFKVTDDYPVANVSWNDANAFCDWLSRKDGKRYRLPSEAEWEYACRAGTTTTYSFGNDREDLVTYGNGPDQMLKKGIPDLPWSLKGNDGHAYLAPVGKYKPNAFGLYDMHGNVIEWCSDKFSFFDPLPRRLPADPAAPVEHVHRGGNWFNAPETAGAGCRSGSPPAFRNSLTGFRIVRDLD